MTAGLQETLRDRIKRNEGCRLKPYQDSLGNWTIGYGHLMTNEISKRTAESLLSDDLLKAIKGYFTLPASIRKGLNGPRRHVLVEMIFQLGIGGFMKFRRLQSALERGDFDTAADEILDSLAAKQCPNRFEEYAHIMRSGELP